MGATSALPPSGKFWNSRDIETELVSGAGFQISREVAALGYYNCGTSTGRLAHDESVKATSAASAEWIRTTVAGNGDGAGSVLASPARRVSLSARGNVIFNRHQGKVLALFLFWLAAGNLNWAQQPASPPQSVSGVVRTPEGTPVPAATVHLVNTETNKAWLSWTDESGKFEFPQIPAGSYRVEASQLGFANASLVVEIPVVPPGPIPIVLRVATLAELTAKPEATRAPRNPRPSGERHKHQCRTGAMPAQARAAVAEVAADEARCLRASATRFAPDSRAVDSSRPILPTKAPAARPAQRTRPRMKERQSRPSCLRAPVPAPLPIHFYCREPSARVSRGTVPEDSARTDWFRAILREKVDPADKVRAADAVGRAEDQAGRLWWARRRWWRMAELRRNVRRSSEVAEAADGGGRGRLNRQAVNRIRFSFYNRYENSVWDAKPYSITGNPVPKPSHYDERFGGNLGGPLKIPHIYNGSDKTFFFVNYQHETQSSALDTYSTVPTAAERTGNFCGLGITLYDPFSNFTGPRTPLGNGCQIPTINTAAAGLLAFYPMPNLPGTVQNYLLQTDGADQQRHVEPARAAHHQFQVQPERRVQPEFPAAEHVWQFSEYGGHFIHAEPVRHAGAFAQLDLAPGGNHAAELEPQPRASAERQFLREQCRGRSGNYRRLHRAAHLRHSRDRISPAFLR